MNLFQIDVMGIMSRLLGGQRIEDARREEKNWVATIDRCAELFEAKMVLPGEITESMTVK
jgi:hypothetical protein